MQKSSKISRSSRFPFFQSSLFAAAIALGAAVSLAHWPAFGASPSTWAASVPEGQKALIDAQNSGRGLNFVEVQSTVVSELLPDDVTGRPHQKWVVTLANNRKLMAVYNSDMGDRIPLKVGEVVSMAGQYIWDRSGGLIHWLHKDPRGRRPDGWVEVGGVKYGQ